MQESKTMGLLHKHAQFQIFKLQAILVLQNKYLCLYFLLAKMSMTLSMSFSITLLA